MAEPRETVETGGYAGPDRRMHEMNGNGYPWWVRAITILGVPSAIAVFLVWIGGTKVPEMMTKVETVYNTQLNMQKEQGEIKTLLEAQLRMQMRVCSNTARNEDERQRCFDK